MPVGVIEFDRIAAQKLNQIPFHLDLRVLARVPLSVAWLPRMDSPDAGIVAWADATLRSRIATEAIRLAQRRPEVVQVRDIRSLS